MPPKTDVLNSGDRVSRIRRALEEGRDADLYSDSMQSNDPLFQAVRRRAKTVAAADKTSFDVRKSFSGVKLTVLDAVESGDRVVVRWRMRGKWTGAFPFAPNIKPTGKAIDITGFNSYRFVGDRVIEKHGEIDVASFQAQAGLNPAACKELLEAVSRPPEERFGGIGGVIVNPGGIVGPNG